jgi:hypothetical protein
MFFPLRLSLVLALSLFLASGEKSAQLPRASGIKMTLRQTLYGTSSEHVTYFRSDARRVEYRNLIGHQFGPHIASIERCDLGQAFELNLDQREYDARTYPPRPLAKEELVKWGLRRPPQVAPQGAATLRIEVTTVDTGERKDFFGHPARHVITTTKETPLEESHSEARESVTDGWYIDLDTRISCDLRWSRNKNGFARITSGNAPLERIEFLQSGDAETGLPVESKVTSKSGLALPDGTKREITSKISMSIVEFVEGPLDPGLFEVPAGFKKVARINSNQPEYGLSAIRIAWQQLVAKVEDFFN